MAASCVDWLSRWGTRGSRRSRSDPAESARIVGRTPLENYVLVCTGRTGFEALLKIVRARIPVVCSNTAPTSLAVEVAREMGITLVCVLPGEEMNVYTHAERIEV
mgnify:CR=1 FL=1